MCKSKIYPDDTDYCKTCGNCCCTCNDGEEESCQACEKLTTALRLVVAAGNLETAQQVARKALGDDQENNVG